jgi:tetratricopeptide (TPR) repeat protein
MSPSRRANSAHRQAPWGAALLSLLLLTGAGVPAPEDAGVHYRRCLDLARSTPETALTEAEDWRSAGGGFPAAHCAAVALFGLKRYAEAARRFEELAGAMMQRRPELRAGALEEAGQAWLLAGNPGAARAAFDAALRFTPGDVELHIDRARAHGAAGAWRDAVADLDAALKLAPDRADALVYRASAWRQLGELDRARADVGRALELVPDQVEGHLERGNIRRLDGDIAGARVDWEEVERLAPGTPAANSAAANLAALAAAK